MGTRTLSINHAPAAQPTLLQTVLKKSGSCVDCLGNQIKFEEMASQLASKGEAADKISTLIVNHKNSTHGSGPFVSIEFFPPR